MLQIYRKDIAGIRDNKFKIHLRDRRLYLQSAKLSNDVPQTSNNNVLYISFSSRNTLL
jgi:hypothetical protein